MQAVNMLQAKTSLSRLVDAIEQGQEREIVIARKLEDLIAKFDLLLKVGLLHLKFLDLGHNQFLFSRWVFRYEWPD